MRWLRQSLPWLLTILVSHGTAITPLEVIASYPELSTLQGYIKSSPSFSNLISTVNNFTFLAPSNDAFEAFAAQNGNSSRQFIEATLNYSLLLGSYPVLSFSDTPQFVATNLANATYTNVTGGQRVELVSGSDGTPEIVTSNKTISTTTADILAQGGIIHIINEVLTIPISLVFEITAAGLEFFTSILTNLGYLSSSNTYVPLVLELTDITFFVPNSAAALEVATQLSANSTPQQQMTLFEYHIVPGFVGYSSLLTDGMHLKTAAGLDLMVTIQDGDTYINAAKIIGFDYLVANGVFHVLDTLLDPNNITGPPPPTTSSTVAVMTSTPTPTSTLPPTPAAQTSVASSTAHPISSLSTGAKAGIGAGAGVAGLLVFAALALFVLRSRKQRGASLAWDDSNMGGIPSDMGKYYVQRGTVQRQEDLNLGLASANMNDAETETEHGMVERDSNGVSFISSGPPSRPSVPPKSPIRVTAPEGTEREFF